MLCWLLLGACAQGPRLELSTRLPVAGVGFSVRALDQHDAPSTGVTLALCDDADHAVATFTTGHDGRAQVLVAHAGAYVLSWHSAGVEVIVPFHVSAPRSPLRLALWTVPLGLFLLWSALRARR
jgi:uncharacterized membrane protein